MNHVCVATKTVMDARREAEPILAVLEGLATTQTPAEQTPQGGLRRLRVASNPQGNR